MGALSLHPTKASRRTRFYLEAGIILIVVLIVSTHADVKYKSTCETIPAEIHITKDEFDKSSGTARTCEENVAVNKCEGACASSLRPSALNPNGFQKECHCCRETNQRNRPIILKSCYDSDGRKLSGTLGTMEVTVNEPMDCQCSACS